MARVADHLSVAELERRFRACPDPVEARHVQAIWLLAQGRTVGATSEVTSFGTRWIEQLLERYNASGPEALANGRRRNGLKPSLLAPEVLEMVRVGLFEIGRGRLSLCLGGRIKPPTTPLLLGLERRGVPALRLLHDERGVLGLGAQVVTGAGDSAW